MHLQLYRTWYIERKMYYLRLESKKNRLVSRIKFNEITTPERLNITVYVINYF